MKRKTIGIIVATLVLTIAGGIGWSMRDLPQRRLLLAAEDMVFTDVDSTGRLLAKVDTSRLMEHSQMLYDLMRALVHEERWHLRYADTASCLSSGSMWSFKRETTHRKSDDKPLLGDSTLLRVHQYFEHASLSGTTDDRDALRRFGRICYAMSRNGNEKAPLLNADKLLHMAIHCGEVSEDHALAFRAYRLLGQKTDNCSQLLYATRALEHFRQLAMGSMSLHDGSSDDGRWLLTLVNDYGCAVLHYAPFDLVHFPAVERMAEEVSLKQGESLPLFQSLDSLRALPAPKFMSATFMRHGNYDESDTAYTSMLEVEVPAEMYEEARRLFDENDENRKRKPDFETEWKNAMDAFNTLQDTYLAAGYEMKAAYLQRRLMTAVIVILLLTLLLLGLLFRNWRIKTKQRHEAERIAHQREAEQLAERLRQKDTMITMLRGHLMDKSEILDMLEPKAGKRTIINARNWREIEMTLDTADGNFVRGHPPLHAHTATPFEYGSFSHLCRFCLCRATPKAEVEKRRLWSHRPHCDP